MTFELAYHCKNSLLNEGHAGQRQRSASMDPSRQVAGSCSTTTRQAASSGRCGGPAAHHATGGHVSWSADKIETCSEQRHLDYFEQSSAGAEGLQLVTMNDRRTRQLERQQDRDLQRTEAPRLLRDKKLTTAVWASIRAGKGPARTERVARRERQIVNLCVFHL